jgi:hypothetical protein
LKDTIEINERTPVISKKKDEKGLWHLGVVNLSMTTYRKNELWSYHCTKSSQSIVNTISYISENILCTVIEYWLNSIKIDLEDENENKKTFVFKQCSGSIWCNGSSTTRFCGKSSYLNLQLLNVSNKYM